MCKVVCPGCVVPLISCLYGLNPILVRHQPKCSADTTILVQTEVSQTFGGTEFVGPKRTIPDFDDPLVFQLRYL